jgi:hypothetical protein
MSLSASVSAAYRRLYNQIALVMGQSARSRGCDCAYTWASWLSYANKNKYVKKRLKRDGSLYQREQALAPRLRHPKSRRGCGGPTRDAKPNSAL